MFTFKTNDYDKYVYQTEIKDFIPDTLIDIHTHIFEKEMERIGDAKGSSTWDRKVADELTGANIISAYEDMFPGKKVTPLVFGAFGKTAEEMNVYVEKEKDMYGFPALFRTHYSMSGEELEEQVKKGGFIGLKPFLTFSPSYLPPNEIRTFDFLTHEHLKMADKNGWIVILHIARSKRLKDEVNIAQLMEIEEKYPNVKLIVAHVGRAYSKQDIGDAFNILKNTKNMLFDFSANVCDDAIRACIEAVGVKRLLFGSDMPISVMRMFRTTDETGFYYNNVPAGLYGDPFDDPHMKVSDRENITIMMYEQLRAFKRVALEMKLSDSDIEDIMYLNSKKILADFGY